MFQSSFVKNSDADGNNLKKLLKFTLEENNTTMLKQ